MGARRRPEPLARGSVRGPYRQKSVKKRIEALFLDNIGQVLTREQIMAAAADPKTKREPEDWHQRLSELRTDDGYTILSWRNRGDLKVQEYLMPHAKKRPAAARRVKPDSATWLMVLQTADWRCQWSEGGETCGLKEADVDPVGGGRVKLTPDHQRPHSVDPKSDPPRSETVAGVVRAPPSHEKKLLGQPYRQGEHVCRRPGSAGGRKAGSVPFLIGVLRV